ncbi:MAG: aminoglycoside 6-adenylyltransferase [Anaerolineales bacterium]|nr:aminoglycoside 6-adenylyltransferase [Anaerolineales bacterium]
MRTEDEMIDLILKYASEDDNIRAVVLNGSRVNPNLLPDIFQDYDVVYYVDEVQPYIHNYSVFEYFGETIIFQLPDEMGDSFSDNPDRYAYLMQFTDGNRIDLTFCLSRDLEKNIRSDTLSLVLLDKDNRIKEKPIPNDRGYWPMPPTEIQFRHCCNEFWWLMPYVAKGLWRGEVIYPWYFQNLMKGELLKMLNWYFGAQTNFEQSPGKLGRFYEDKFDRDLWGMIKEVFSLPVSGNFWKTLYTMGELFRDTAQDVARHFGYRYPHQDDARVTEFVRLIQTLPQDASSFDP